MIMIMIIIAWLRFILAAAKYWKYSKNKKAKPKFKTLKHNIEQRILESGLYYQESQY